MKQQEFRAFALNLRGVQPTACRPHVAQDGYECSPTQNCKFTYNLLFCSSVFVTVCVFNAWLKATLLPAWPRDAKRLDTCSMNDGTATKAHLPLPVSCP